MGFHSMTGFGRADGGDGVMSWHFEARSVNGRGLDVRVRVPPGMDAIEPKIREMAQQRLSRGSVTIGLHVQRQVDAVEIRLNERALAQVAKAAGRLRELLGSEPVRAEALLGVRGVLEFVEPVESEADQTARVAAMMATLDRALAGLMSARAEEGARLADVFRGQLDEIEARVAAVAASPARRPEVLAQKLKEMVARIGDAGMPLDPQRLHQEAVLLATRADVEEELKRLASHVAAARQLIGAGGAVGRKLDFLSQEFFREANTLCSKSTDAEITANGLELKRVIDQMREQVQNIE